MPCSLACKEIELEERNARLVREKLLYIFFFSIGSCAYLIDVWMYFLCVVEVGQVDQNLNHACKYRPLLVKSVTCFMLQNKTSFLLNQVSVLNLI